MYDYIIIGAGIVGLSTAWQLQLKFPHKRILVLEKEGRVAQHQTGHNSGVIHAGIYYQPGSLKAKFCKEGVEATMTFCREQEIPFEQCGKLIVATNAQELERLRALYERSLSNGLDVELLDSEQLREREPNVLGLGAIYLASTGIVDYALVCRKLAACFMALGGELMFQAEVCALRENEAWIEVELSSNKTYKSRFLISCSGLWADRCCDMLGLARDFHIIPFRGEYYCLAPQHNDIVKHLIYPVPDPALPFLGVHLTRMIDGRVSVGPNALLGWKREGYGRLNFNLKEALEMLSFVGFWRMLGMNFKSAIAELKGAWCKQHYLQQVQKYCPSVQLADLQPYPAGIRAQAVRRDGSLVHDFLFTQSPRSLHVCNAPSPAATSALPIGAYLVEKISAAERAAL